MSLSTYYEALQLKIVKERGSGPTSQDGGGRTRPACLSAPTPVGPAAVVARGHFRETSEAAAVAVTFARGPSVPWPNS